MVNTINPADCDRTTVYTGECRNFSDTEWITFNSGRRRSPNARDGNTWLIDVANGSFWMRDDQVRDLVRLIPARPATRDDRWRRAHSIVEAERDQAREQRAVAERERNDLRRQVEDLTERRQNLVRERDLDAKLAKCMSDFQDMEDECDMWRARAEAAEARLADPYSQANQDAEAWQRVAAHPALRWDLLPEADHTYAGGVFERITQLAETAEAVTEMKPAPAVTREDVAEAISDAWGRDGSVSPHGVLDVVCDLFGVSAGQATCPVTEKARELARAGGIDFDEQEPRGVEMLIGMARYVLDQEAGQ